MHEENRAGYAPEFRNKSSQREDIIVSGPTLAHVAVIEVRYPRTEKSMSEDAECALHQIKKTKYVTAVKGYEKVRLWGISFCKKSCTARAEEYQRPQP